MADTALADTTARGQLMPTTAMAVMEAMAVMAMADTPMARGPLTPMPTTAMAVMEAMAVMAVMALALTDTARGPLTPMPTMAMAVMEAMVVMADMADTDTARGPLMPMPTTAMVVMPVTAAAMERGPLTLTTDMAVMPVTAVATDTAMASNSSNKSAIISSHQIVIPCISEKFILYRRPGK